MYMYHSVLQIWKGNKELRGNCLYFLIKIIRCDPSLEPSHGDGSNEGSQYMFILRKKRNKKKYRNILKNPPYLELYVCYFIILYIRFYLYGHEWRVLCLNSR